MYRALHERYPYAHCELDFENPLQLLVATMLSAQTTDVMVNKVTPQLFAQLPRRAADLAGADREEMETLLKPTGFFRAKTNSVMKLGADLVERFDGEVPPRMKDLVTLPGVGRKTANVVLGNAFGIPGITVDTHFGRLVRRFGWTDEEDPVKVEHAVGRADPPQGVDDAVPRPDLPRPPHLPRARSRPAEPARSRAGARPTASARPTRTRPPSCSSSSSRPVRATRDAAPAPDRAPALRRTRRACRIDRPAT